MIRLDDKLNLEGYGLLLLNNKLTITKTIKNEYILIDDSIELNVMDNVDVNIECDMVVMAVGSVKNTLDVEGVTVPAQDFIVK